MKVLPAVRMQTWALLPLLARMLLSIFLLGALPAGATDQEWYELEKRIDNNPAQALKNAEQALRQSEQRGDKAGQLKALRILNTARILVGDTGPLAEEAKRGVALARELGDMDSLAWLLVEMAWTEFDAGRDHEGTALHDEALAIAEEHKLGRTLAHIYRDKGSRFLALSRASDAMAWFSKAYALFETQGDRYGIAITLSNMCSVWERAGVSAEDAAKSIEYRMRALSLIDPDVYRNSAALFNEGIGVSHARLDDNTRAKEFLTKALILYRKLQSTAGISENANWLGQIAVIEKRYADALAHFDAALPWLKDSRKDLFFNGLLQRAFAQSRLGRKQESLDTLAEARALLPQIDKPEITAAYHDYAAKILAESGDSQEAYRQMRMLREADQRHAEAINKKLTDQLKVKFDVQVKEKENVLLRAQQQEAEARRLALVLTLALSLVLLVSAIFYLRRRAAKARSEAEHHKALAAAKSTFLSNMSHELRSPLNAMLGFTRLLKNDAGLPRESRDDLAIVLRNGEHLHVLINQVLDLSKIEAGRAILQEQDLDVYELLDELADTFALMASQKGLRLSIDCPSDVPRFIRMDAVKLRQVLTNLLSNAIKFTDTGSIAMRVSPSGDSSARRLSFAVADTGRGIASGELRMLGTAFVQAEAGREASEGTGLGLAISRGFVQLMGGELRLSSQAGQGTTVEFDLPLHIAAAPDTAVASIDSPRVRALAPHQPRYRILAVDDRPESRLLLVRLLSPLGFEVREAGNGEEALAVWEAWEPHLVLMDMRMPVMDGWEATRRIKALDKGKATVIIALTASSYDEDRAQILAAGCDDFLRKPFREDALLDLLHKHLGAVFVYEDAPPATIATATEIGPASMAALPAGLRAQLIDALERLDPDAVDDIITAIRAHDAGLAKTILELAARFEYDRLLTMLTGENYV